jgi:hypothetical protein
MDTSIKRFSDISKENEELDGSKLRIDDIINQEIKILAFSVRNTKYPKDGRTNYLTIQFEMENEKHVVFTGSEVLTRQLQSYQEQLPFFTTIKKKFNRYYTLS